MPDGTARARGTEIGMTGHDRRLRAVDSVDL